MGGLIGFLSGGSLRRNFFLLLPGLSLKRWLALGVLGAATLALGLAFAFQLPVGSSFASFVGLASLRNLPPSVRGGVFLVIGAFILAFAGFMLYKSLTSARRKTRVAGLLDSLYVDRVLGSGPKVVAIGGGTGLATLLRGLKHYTTNITAIVTVADDGGSSGRLRTELGILPPGDIRNCLVALADSENVMQLLMDFRFSTSGELNGHSFGNILIAALAQIGGGFDRGVEMAGDLLAIRGKVIPSTSVNVTLLGSTVSGHTLVGESRVGTTTERLSAVTLVPPDAPAHPEAIKAIEEADLIILGPGSLFTSIVPNLLVKGIAASISRSTALKVYICNVAEQPGETVGYSLMDHLKIVRHYSGETAVDVVLANGNIPQSTASAPVRLITPISQWKDHAAYVLADVIDEDNISHHDPAKLAEVVAVTYRRYRGIRRRLPRGWRMPLARPIGANERVEARPNHDQQDNSQPVHSQGRVDAPSRLVGPESSPPVRRRKAKSPPSSAS